MSSFFENDILLQLFSIVIAIAGWLYTSKVNNIRARRAIRATLIYLVFPVAYLGHPFLFYQVWMFVVASVVNFDLKWLLIMFSIWFVVVGILQIGVTNERKAI